jgi:hypothetical protein
MGPGEQIFEEVLDITTRISRYPKITYIKFNMSFSKYITLFRKNI